MTTPISARIPNHQAALVKQRARQAGMTVSQTLAVVIERGLNQPDQ